MDDNFHFELSQEEGMLLLTSARLLDKLVAGVTIHAQDRDELIGEIIDKLARAVRPDMSSMSDELANAILESVLGCDELDDVDELNESIFEAFDDIEYQMHDTIPSSLLAPGEFMPQDPRMPTAELFSSATEYPMYCTDSTLPALEQAMIDHTAVKANYYSFARESVDLVTLNPLLMLKEQGLWRMVAYCHEKDEIMIFRVDRIKDLVQTEVHFEAPSNINQLRHTALASYC